MYCVLIALATGSYESYGSSQESRNPQQRTERWVDKRLSWVSLHSSNNNGNLKDDVCRSIAKLAQWGDADCVEDPPTKPVVDFFSLRFTTAKYG